MAPYRPPGRSNRSGRAQADNDIFEGLPVKQWTHTTARISLAPPVSEVKPTQGQDKWSAEPPMPRDFQLLQPYTQQLLRLARSGKVGQKRKAARENNETNGEDADERDEDANHADEVNGLSRNGLLDENRAFVAKKWKHVPEHALVPEHLHWEFLAPRRKGLPSFYYGNADGYVPIPTRRTRVSKIIDAVSGEIAVYDVLAPEGQSIENEVVEGSELAAMESTTVAPGVVIEGVGIANDDGVLVMEARNAAAAMAQRRNRPPPKKKGGPGRGKKRVTFTNPDGSTYTTIVPNATKIVPQPGQTVKHVAKGEEAARDITAEEAATIAKATHESDGDGDEDDDDEDGDEEGEDEEGEEEAGDDAEGEDREDGEVAEDVTMHDDAAQELHINTAEDKLEAFAEAETAGGVLDTDSQAIPSLDGAADEPETAPPAAELATTDEQERLVQQPRADHTDLDMTDSDVATSAEKVSEVQASVPEPSVSTVEREELADTADIPVPDQTIDADQAPAPDEPALEPDAVLSGIESEAPLVETKVESEPTAEAQEGAEV